MSRTLQILVVITNNRFKIRMEWSNLNEQMIEQFFQHSNSPSNADVSLNFTRTSRESGSNSKPIIIHRQSSPKPYEKSATESDLLTTADMEIQKFDSWLNFINSEQQRSCKQMYHFSDTTTEDDYLTEFYNRDAVNGSLQKSLSLENQILEKIQNLSNKLTHHPISTNCHNCIPFQNKLSELQIHTKSIQIELKAKNQQLAYLSEVQINQLGQQMPYQVQNRLLHQEIAELKNKNNEILEILEGKQKDINKLNEQIEKFNLERSTFYFKNRTLENKVLEMQKSKILSATKHSTSHSQFNITTSNNNNSLIMKSQQQSNIDSTLINTNQFSTQKPSPEQYIQWFQKVKQVFLEKYRLEEKQYLLKQHPQAINNQNKLKDIVNEFRKRHVRYEVARSCKNIAEYIKKNKQNFFDLIGNESLSGLRSGIQIGRGKDNGRNIDELQQEIRKSQKISKGLQSEICHLNNQLSTLKKTLIKQKQQKAHLLRTNNNLRQQLQETQCELKSARQQLNHTQSKIITPNISDIHHQFEQKLILLQQQLIFKSEELTFKTEELKKINYKCKRQEEAQQKLQLAIKQSQYLLYKERKDKIKFFKQTLSSQNLITACRIRPKSITQKHLSSIVHEFEGKIHVDKQKLSYKYDIIEQVGKKSQSEISSCAKKIIQNCIYQPNSSLFLSMGSHDSEFRQFMRNEKGMMWNCVNEIFKLKQSEKRFLQITVHINSIGMHNTQVYDALDRQNPQKKISIKRQGTRFSLLNCMSIIVQNQQQAKSILTSTMINQRSNQSNIITIFELEIIDKRNKEKFVSKVIFGEVGLYNMLNKQHGKQGVQNLVKDSQAIWNVFNSINFKQKYQPEFNRLTHLLSECLNQNNKNILIMNISPTELYKQISIASLTYGASLKSLETQSSTSGVIVRLVEKGQQNNLNNNKIVQNKSQSLIKQQVVNGDSSEEKGRPILKHRNSSSEHPTSSGAQILQKKKRTISRLSIC